MSLPKHPIPPHDPMGLNNLNANLAYLDEAKAPLTPPPSTALGTTANPYEAIHTNNIHSPNLSTNRIAQTAGGFTGNHSRVLRPFAIESAGEANAKVDIVFPNARTQPTRITGYTEVELAGSGGAGAFIGKMTKAFELAIAGTVSDPIYPIRILQQITRFTHSDFNISNEVTISDAYFKGDDLVITVASLVSHRNSLTLAARVKIFGSALPNHLMSSIYVSETYTDDPTVYSRAGALSWVEPVFQNGWARWTQSVPPLRFARDPRTNLVHIRGFMAPPETGIVANIPAFILPAGFRPGQDMPVIFPIYTESLKPLSIRILTNGNVTVMPQIGTISSPGFAGRLVGLGVAFAAEG
jgi:hypothetical protein